MTRFFKTIFQISLIEILIILALCLLKFIVLKLNIVAAIKLPMIWLGLAMGALFVITVGIRGIIENKQDITEPDSTRLKYQAVEKKFAWLLQAGILIPSLSCFLIMLYIILPDSKEMFMLLAAGILIRNSISYFWNRNKQPDSEPV